MYRVSQIDPNLIDCSDDFVNLMVLPMIALFLGTGNATPDVSSVVMERLITSPSFGQCIVLPLAPT